MVEFIALPFPFSSKLKIYSFPVVVVQGRQRNFQKSVKHVQTSSFCRFVDQTYCFFSEVLVTVAVVVAQLKLPYVKKRSENGQMIYRKIPKISPWAYIFQTPFLRGLFLEGLIYGGKCAFQNRFG